MIIIEDSSFPLENEFDCILPFGIRLINNELKIIVYDIVQDIADEFLEKFISDPFCDTAFDYLNMKLAPIAEKLGYELDSKRLYTWNHLYYMDDINRLNTDVILPNTVKWEADSNYKNLTTFDFEYIQDRVMFATIIDNQIVSYACDNPHDEDYERSIAVETAPDYRNHGYAVSNVAALTKYNLQLKYPVRYTCSRYNIASQRTAGKVGFPSIGKGYYYPCYRK
jgi:Predicted acetyltransferase